MFICPKCSQTLRKTISSYVCENNHCYDISSKGYVNLLLGNKQSGHGDNKEMLLARRSFLNLGHYFPIIKKLREIIYKNTKFKFTMLDAGCGEGYYIEKLVAAFFEIGRYPTSYAIDVSKDAVALAAKSLCGEYAVASINSLPFAPESFDVVLSLFAPLNEAEFHRVLKPGGILITVSPSKNHLYGLKEAVYDTPYKNPPPTFNNKLLKKIDEETVEAKMELNNGADISNLFKMTPYYHKSSPSDIEKALSLTHLETQIGFNFITYKKI